MTCVENRCLPATGEYDYIVSGCCSVPLGVNGEVNIVLKSSYTKISADICDEYFSKEHAGGDSKNIDFSADILEDYTLTICQQTSSATRVKMSLGLAEPKDNDEALWTVVSLVILVLIAYGICQFYGVIMAKFRQWCRHNEDEDAPRGLVKLGEIQPAE